MNCYGNSLLILSLSIDWMLSFSWFFQKKKSMEICVFYRAVDLRCPISLRVGFEGKLSARFEWKTSETNQTKHNCRHQTLNKNFIIHY